MEATELITLDGDTISVLGRLDRNNSAHTELFSSAVEEAIGNGFDNVIIDFTGAPMLSSSVISLIFVAYEIANKSNASITVKASVNDHRPLVSSGINNYVDLQLCS